MERMARALQDAVDFDWVVIDECFQHLALEQQAQMLAGLAAGTAALSHQELEILRLVGRGRRNADIAAQLHLVSRHALTEG